MAGLDLALALGLGLHARSAKSLCKDPLSIPDCDVFTAGRKGKGETSRETTRREARLAHVVAQGLITVTPEQHCHENQRKCIQFTKLIVK